MLKLPVKPPIVNENIDLSEYAKKSDVDAIGTSLGNKAEKKEVEKINSQLDTLTKKVDDEIKEIQSTTDTFKENINTSFNEFSNEQQNNFEALRGEVLSDIEASYVGYDNEQHHNLESRLNSDFDKINQRVNDSSYLEYEGTSIKADNTYYGLTKEATVKGRTLQNLVGDFLKTDNNASYENGVGILPNPNCNVFFGNDLLKSNTVYTCLINVVQYDCSEKIKIVLVSGNGSGLGFCELTPGDVGLVRLKISGTEKNHFKIVIWRRVGDSEGVFKFKDFMVLEGDHTNTPIEELPFVEGIQGTGDTTKNLFNVNLVQGTIGSDGQFVNDTSAVRTNKSIKVEGGKTYVKSNSLGVKRGRIAFYNNSEFISAVTDTDAFTVPSNANEVMFSIYKGSTLSPNDILWVQLEEGTTATPYEPYYDGYKIEILSNGKNLLNPNNATKDNVVNPEGDNLVISGSYGGAWKPLYKNLNLPQGYYCLQIDILEGTYEGGNIGIKDLSGNLMHQSKLPDSKIIVNCKQGISELCVWACNGNCKIRVFLCRVDSADSPFPTPYEYYKEDKTQILLDKPLMQLPNGVADSINLETGVLTRRVGEITLNGTESNYSIYGGDGSQETETTIAFKYRYYEHRSTWTNKKNAIVDTMPVVGDLLYGRSDCGYASDDDFLIFRIEKKKLGTQDADGFKKWLQANPTTICYELKNPTTKQLIPTQLKSFEGTTHIMSNNTLQAHTSVKIPSNVQAVVTNLINENEALRSNVDILNVENEGLKETNEVQDELIDMNMMATDEVYTMIEPLLASQPMSMERGMSKLVDMYVAMVQRGLKTTIDQVPIRYRAEVQAILEALEK